MCAKRVKQKPEDVPTTGHIWDGIEELDNPMPRWWVWVFYATIVWGIGYTIAYPAWPLISGATPGLLGSSTRADVVAEIKRFDDANATIKQALIDADMTTVSANPDLMSFAQNAGAAVFRTNCTTCHGSGANGKSWNTSCRCRGRTTTPRWLRQAGRSIWTTARPVTWMTARVISLRVRPIWPMRSGFMAARVMPSPIRSSTPALA